MNIQIAITGATGFVGTNLVSYLEQEKFTLFTVGRNIAVAETNGSVSLDSFNALYINENNINVVVHLAGKAHDLKDSTDDEEYFRVNTVLTKNIYDEFVTSNASVFIFISSVKAVTDHTDQILFETAHANPKTNYGISKRKAEEYIESVCLPEGKRYIILRPCIVHGPGNKGNLNLLYKFIQKGIPYPLGSFDNKRSFLSVDNLCFVITRIILNSRFPSGTYQIADDEPMSTNDLITEISNCLGKKTKIWKISKPLIRGLAKLSDRLHLPFTTERLVKLTESYEVSNAKIINALQVNLPISSRDGIRKTINSFKIFQ